MIITISGMPGSGKSTVAKTLALRLGLRHYSVGDFRRESAKKRGMTLEEYNKAGEEQNLTDKDADEWQEQIGEKEDNFIIDGRLSWHFIPKSIKLFLNVSPEEGARRIMGAKRSEEQAEDIDKAIMMWQTRIESDKLRYKKYYNIDCYELKHYDFVLDTTTLTEDQVVILLMQFIEDMAPLY